MWLHTLTTHNEIFSYVRGPPPSSPSDQASETQLADDASDERETLYCVHPSDDSSDNTGTLTDYMRGMSSSTRVC